MDGDLVNENKKREKTVVFWEINVKQFVRWYSLMRNGNQLGN
jgi:hypothetical protein